MAKYEIPTVEDLVKAYNFLVQNIDDQASSGKNGDRAYGGIVRAGKGLLVESMAKGLVSIAWKNIGGDENRISFEKDPIIVPLKTKYLERIQNPIIKKHISDHIGEYFYRFKTDVHVYIDDELAIGVECKAYTENAMLKRIMVDFTFLRQAHPKADAVLLQLESQLGGDYGEIFKEPILGSASSRTIMSYFDVDLNIITLLEGERKVDAPIHKKDFFKSVSDASLQKTVEVFEELLRKRLANSTRTALQSLA